MIQEKKRVLGRGLESLIPAARPSAPAAVAPVMEVAPGERVEEIRLEEIEPSPYQPRRHQDDFALEELAQSIREQGVLQPIVLRTVVDRRPSTVDGQNGDARDTGAAQEIKYQLIAGERRWLASKRAGRETVPAIVRVVSNEQAMEIALIENLQREDLDCMEMAFAFDRLGREFGLTQEQMAKRTGKDRATIGNLMRLLRLPQEVQFALLRHELTFSHAKELLELEDDTVIAAAAQKILREGLSVRQTQELVNKLVWLGPNKEKKKEKKAPVEDPNVRAARVELEGRLGCRVRIFDHDGKGKVVIEYKGLDDFDRIVEALGR